jgi:outer membrane protein TolC
VARAQENNPRVMEARAALETAELALTLEGRLAEALTVKAGAGVSGTFEQATPSYSFSVSVDVMSLVSSPAETQVLASKLASALAESRVETVEAFIRYVIARNAAEAAARAVESSEAGFRVVSARLEVGDATVSDQLAAQTAVGNAAVALLRANGEVIIAAENLAAVVGLSATETMAVIEGGEPVAVIEP